MTENEFTLEDRLGVIRNAEERFRITENGYLSFSGGKDSTVLHHLLDMALPGNQIPRVFIDTGIEYKAIREFVMGMAENDNRFVIVKPSVAVKAMLERDGYPFKSKEFSRRVYDYHSRAETIDQFKDMPADELKEYMLANKEFERSLIGKGIFIIYYLKDLRAKRDENGYLVRFEDASKFSHPKNLEFMFDQKYKLKVNSKCCQRLKKDPVKKWEKANGRTIAMTGMRKEEGGQRANIQGCILTDKKGQVRKFHPLLVVSDEWEEWLIEREGIKLCALYYPPFNFKRTGCKGCPFSLDLQEQLTIMEKYLPAERKQCETIWGKVYDEYRRIGYRLSKAEQLKLF